MASFATSSVSSFSTAVKQTTISSSDTGFGSISSADWISFFVGSYEMLSQCNCKIRILTRVFAATYNLLRCNKRYERKERQSARAFCK